MTDKSASEQIDDIIKQFNGWKGDLIKRLRAIILDADSRIVEEVKWKTPSRQEGLPVWSYDGIVCFIEIWKDNIKLIFFKGAQLTDAKNLFNARLKSATVRAIELREGDQLNEAGIKELAQEAVLANIKK